MKASIAVATLVLICGLVNAGSASPLSARKYRHHFQGTRLVRAPHRANPTNPSGTDLSNAAEEDDERRFQTAKEKAKTEPRLQELKAKADNAVTDEEARKAAVTYNRALFRRIREIDNSVTDRANEIEEAILRRIEE
jgi:hypothetical protein